MSRSWAQIVRGKPTLNPNAPEWKPKPRCVDCGGVAEVCRRCTKNAVHEHGLCGMCWSWDMPSESMCIGYVRLSNDAHKMPFKCEPCRTAPKKRTDLKTGYVEMADILAGQRVTGEQFFDAVLCAEAEAKGEDVSHISPHKLSRALLERELARAEEYCSMWVREIRTLFWSQQDVEAVVGMNYSIAALREELDSR